MANPTVILASGSKARQEMLRNAGVSFDVIPADIDEEKILSEMVSNNKNVEDIAKKLAEEKSLKISKENKDNYIIGSDQILSLNNKLYSKAKNKNEAKEKLLELSSKTHQLTSAVCVTKNNKIIWSSFSQAQLSLKDLTEEKIDNYLERAGDDIYNCVGCYALESIGIQLFDKIEGDYFTILGMPLLPLLTFLEKEGVLA